jgi:hypothetical protein
MGRTNPSATIVFQQEEAAFGRFRRALRRSDQLALDDLFTSAHQHLAAAQYAAHALPFEVFLLSMLLEEHKQVIRLREGQEALLQQFEALRDGHAALLQQHAELLQEQDVLRQGHEVLLLVLHRVEDLLAAELAARSDGRASPGPQAVDG